jgi:hypothetical protein
MKRILLLLSIVLFCSILNGQTDPWSRRELAKADSILIKSDIENIQFCLGQYHKSRKAGFIMAGTAIVLVGASTVLADSRYDNLNLIMLIGSAALSVGCLVTLFDSEKWLKRATIKLSPGQIKVYF